MSELLIKGTIQDKMSGNKQNIPTGCIKKINIEYVDKKNCLIVKLSFTDLALNIENSDEVIFSSQLISALDNKINIDIDEHRRLTFRSTISFNHQTSII